MTGKDSQSINRRSFLRGTAVMGACLLSAGIVGGLKSGIPGLGSKDAVALPVMDTLFSTWTQRKALGIIGREGVVTRLGILSDAHICTYDSFSSDKVARALETLGRAVPGIDALFMLGDVSLNGHDDELDAFASLTAEVLLTDFSPVPPMHLLMGNHDYWVGNERRFEAVFEAHEAAALFVAGQNTVACLPGVTIIKLNGTGCYEVDLMDFSGAYAFLVDALEEASTERPDDAILVMAHEPPEQMSLPESLECGYFGQGTRYDMVRLMAQYPQLRMFSGHIHNHLEIPASINRDLGFVSVHTSAVGSCLFIQGILFDRSQKGSQGLVLDIMEDGRVLLHRLDFSRQEYLGAPVSI